MDATFYFVTIGFIIAGVMALPIALAYEAYKLGINK